ncbi:hypothetical protein [Nocardia sp. NPDC051750]|uniref:hypothetical protein n=1 Tax=Nocardia sp. NPDC051750 TaxID=3364325 RepID=UPI0037B51B0A
MSSAEPYAELPPLPDDYFVPAAVRILRYGEVLGGIYYSLSELDANGKFLQGTGTIIV